MLEFLEERTLLSVFTVTDNSDSPTDTGSLRYAINNEPSGTTIDFASNVTGTITLTNGALNIATNLDVEGPGSGVLTISGNYANTVVDVGSGVTAMIAGLTISHGSSYVGGIYNQGELTVIGSTISNNSAINVGGGIFNWQGTLAVINSTISNNTSTSGGGILNEGTFSLTDCTISNNSAFYGGGVYDQFPGTLTAVNSTIAYNVVNSGGSGGGIYQFDGDDSTVLDNTVVALNTRGTGGGSPADDISGSVDTTNSYNNLIGTGGSGGLSIGVNDNIVLVGTGSPGLGTLANNGGPTQTIALLSGSPAIDNGSNSISGVTVPTTDQRGAAGCGRA